MSKHRVFIFMSEPVVGELTEFRLRLLDLEPIVLSSNEELESELENGLPSLFMLDLDLAETDTTQLIEKLASDEITSRIPILCVSREGDMGEAERAYQAGARDFLVIPYDPLVLERKVLRTLESLGAPVSEQQGISL
ncbi:MAG TPA: hypothetical protein DDW52_28130 [Planctomycetaceae bacterium]|nr:hypothetical protein [Planctomycetaceae bacterium]